MQQDVAEIANGLREEAVASSDIARNVERIATMVEANSQAVNQTAAATAELERLSATLLEEVSRFSAILGRTAKKWFKAYEPHCHAA
ncbi:MAG: hypothetical protein IPH08_11605 [Rhodocyclaceae bacterium]|nr:hypothetical protein [Rhodocyclaceae bacterium]